MCPYSKERKTSLIWGRSWSFVLITDFAVSVLNEQVLQELLYIPPNLEVQNASCNSLIVQVTINVYFVIITSKVVINTIF